MNTYAKLISAVVVLIATTAPVYAATYYVNLNGNDSSGGTSIATAWKSTAKIGTRIFLPGDKILF